MGHGKRYGSSHGHDRNRHDGYDSHGGQSHGRGYDSHGGHGRGYDGHGGGHGYDSHGGGHGRSRGGGFLQRLIASFSNRHR